jgi:hypothetical protein
MLARIRAVYLSASASPARRRAISTFRLRRASTFPPTSRALTPVRHASFTAIPRAAFRTITYFATASAVGAGLVAGATNAFNSGIDSASGQLACEERHDWTAQVLRMASRTQRITSGLERGQPTALSRTTVQTLSTACPPA